MPALLLLLAASLFAASADAGKNPASAASEALGAAEQDEAVRIAFGLDIAAAEYARAVEGGRLDKVEQAEAVDFLAQARKRFARLADSTGLDDFSRGPLERALAALEADARSAKADPGAFRAAAARAGQELAAAYGAEAHPAPARRPSARAGAEVYRMHCAMCHGARGDGRGPATPGLDPKPARFDRPDDVRRSSPADLFRVVAVGVEGTAMTGFDDRLSAEQRWDAVQHLYSFSKPRELTALGESLLAAHAAALPAELRAEPFRAGASDEELEVRVASALPRSNQQDRRAMAAALRLEEPSAARKDSRGPALDAVAAEVSRALALQAAGDAEGAAAAALDAYLRFEPVEAEARVDAPALAAALERDFAAFQDALRSGAPRADLEERAGALRRGLEGLRAGGGAAGAWGAFAQSFLIMAREGFEAILIVGAIAALLARAGKGALLGVFYAGAWAAVAASLLTAWALEAVFRVTPVQREALEGVVMMTASVVLVYVSYWMLAAAGHRNWNQWLRGRLGNALEGGGGWALASVSFLAVYREGFETVLFYKALYGFAPEQGPAIAFGLAAGCAALAALFLVMRSGALRLPMRPFFLGTGALLYAMAFVFSGQGVAELQAAGWLSATATPWGLSAPWAGVRPTWETCAPQLLLAAGALTALVLGRRGAGSTLIRTAEAG